MPFQELVEVYTALEPIEVSVVVGLLEAAGIEPRVRDLSITPYPISVGTLGEKRITVPEEQAAAARSVLLKAVEDGILGTEERIMAAG